MVLKEVHLGQPSQYARKTCIFSGLVMKVLHTSLVDMPLMMKHLLHSCCDRWNSTNSLSYNRKMHILFLKTVHSAVQNT